MYNLDDIFEQTKKDMSSFKTGLRLYNESISDCYQILNDIDSDLKKYQQKDRDYLNKIKTEKKSKLDNSNKLKKFFKSFSNGLIKALKKIRLLSFNKFDSKSNFDNYEKDL